MVDLTKTDIYDGYSAPDNHVEIALKVLRTVHTACTVLDPASHAESMLAMNMAEYHLTNLVALVQDQPVPFNFANPNKPKPRLLHEFDSSQTCNYCGMAAERTTPNEPCMTRNKVKETEDAPEPRPDYVLQLPGVAASKEQQAPGP